MARMHTPAVLAQIRSARTYADQIAAFRALKNEIIGHVQKKEKWVELGVLEAVVNILSSSRSTAKLNGRNGHLPHDPSRPLAEDELVRLQALQLLGSFANGGPAFLAPLYATGALPAILNNVTPLDNSPQTVLTALRTLLSIADAATLVLPGSTITTAQIADQVFTPRSLDALHAILASKSPSAVAQAQISCVAILISNLCRDHEAHQNAVANSGILDALTTILASFVVAQGKVVPGAEIVGRADGLAGMIPEPAPPTADLAVILRALATITADSRFRSSLLLHSPAMLAVFPDTHLFSTTREIKNAFQALDMAGWGSLRAANIGAMDCLLPVVPTPPSKALSAHAPHFPPLGFAISKDFLGNTNGRSASTKLSTWAFDLLGPGGDGEAEEVESPLVPWLIDQARSGSPMERLGAAHVLTCIFKASLASPAREASIGVLVVPMLLQLIDGIDMTAVERDSNVIEAGAFKKWALLELAPAVLARMVADSEPLQRSAFDCGAVKTICKLLQTSYEPLSSPTAPQPWSPTSEKGPDQDAGVPTWTLGQPGLSPLQAHRVRLRESALRAMAAVMSLKEDYRKAFIEQDIVPFVVESLSPNPTKPKVGKEGPKSDKVNEKPTPASSDAAYGSNPNSVIIAACHVIRMLTRSVSILRTELEDYGVTMAVFRLLRHPDIEVQTAACASICNLLLEVSPMRVPLMGAGVLKVLSEHAHSVNAGLRLNALWGLKHLVHANSMKVKKECLEELSPGWLVHLIHDDIEDDALYDRPARERRMSDEDSDSDVEMDQYEDDGRAWVWSGTQQLSNGGRSSSDRVQSSRLQKIESKLATIREAELSPMRKARNDDLAIQEQGLNLIRNLIGPVTGATLGADSLPHDTTEMINLVFMEIGEDILFKELQSKLRVKVLRPFSRRYVSGSGTGAGAGSNGGGGGGGGGGAPSKDARVLYPQARIIAAVVWILVHIAASVPQHRQLVVAQTELLKLVLSHASNLDKDVRVALCHLVANLAWQDDAADAAGCAQRALELRRLGFQARLEVLEAEDPELDVRERAKGALWQMRQGSL